MFFYYWPQNQRPWVTLNGWILYSAASMMHPRPAISEAKAKASGLREAKAKQVNLRFQGQDR